MYGVWSGGGQERSLSVTPGSRQNIVIEAGTVQVKARSFDGRKLVGSARINQHAVANGEEFLVPTGQYDLSFEAEPFQVGFNRPTTLSHGSKVAVDFRLGRLEFETLNASDPPTRVRIKYLTGPYFVALKKLWTVYKTGESADLPPGTYQVEFYQLPGQPKYLVRVKAGEAATVKPGRAGS
jgi:hypothetical protein